MRKILIGLLGYTFVSQQMLAQTDSIADTRELKAVVVKATNGIKSRFRVDNAEIIGQGQLIRAACCNLGESFTANPSVDVSYSDAATGAKQIKLLGLSGTYVQMLTENVPNLRGAALPYSLGYVPGPWMQSIQVSKGASSVKNGYESTTGQINIEFLKPQGTDGVRANVYQDSELKTEVNLDGSVHLNERLSTATLLHFENRQMDHDGNGDGFMDMPKLRQYNLMHRWAYVSPRWISQLMRRCHRRQADKAARTERHLRADAHRERAQPARRSPALQFGLCAWSLDAVDTGEQGSVEREERIRKHNGTDKHRVSEAARHRWHQSERLSGQRTEDGGEPRRKRSSQRTPFYRNTSPLREPTDGPRRQRRRLYGYAEVAPV